MTFALWFTFLCLALAASFSPGPGVLLAISTTMTLGARPLCQYNLRHLPN
jgi:homoserine/homoserine lactone efflux protein